MRIKDYGLHLIDRRLKLLINDSSYEVHYNGTREGTLIKRDDSFVLLLHHNSKAIPFRASGEVAVKEMVKEFLVERTIDKIQ